MKLLLIFCTVLIGAASAEDHNSISDKEIGKQLRAEEINDATATVPELIAKNGYPVETHEVTTEDGYILTVHRIPAEGKPVVFLMHGMICSSADWIIAGPGRGLGYILADAGYDVWMGNARGNYYSRNHQTIKDVSKKGFWQFDWHEIGIYDLPAMIDYALESTGQEKLAYIGHSQGTTSFYVMASTKPEYNEKIKVSFSLAPVAYMSNLESPLIQKAAKNTDTLTTLLNVLRIYELLPRNIRTPEEQAELCLDDELGNNRCAEQLFELMGYNEEQLDKSLLPLIFGHTPAGASTRQFAHYGQGIKSGKFRWWDYGRVQNLIKYKSFNPPKYDLSLITAPLHLVYSDNDWMAAVEDVKQLWSEIGNPAGLYRISDDKWNHIDFIWGIDAKKYVYDYILDTLETKYKD